MNLTATSLQTAFGIMEECKHRLEEALHCDVELEYKLSSSFSKTSAGYALTMDHILTCVSVVLNISQTAIKSHTRKTEVKNARFIAMHLMYEYKAGTKKGIGLFFDGRDHSTVINAIRKCQGYCETEKRFLQKYIACKEQCKKLMSEQ